LRPVVGIIGTGNMGGAMALRLLDCGFEVWVHDIRPEAVRACSDAGARVCARAAEVASAADLVIVAVVDATQVAQVICDDPQSLLSAARLPRTVCLCSTISPQDVRCLSEPLLSAGVAVLDAPMSGGPVRAREGSMSLMLAGPRASIAQHQSVLDALSSKPFFISERLGDAATTKLVNNLLAGINLVGAAQAMLLAQKMGLDWNRTLDVIEASSGQSWIGSDRMRRAGAGDFAPRAHVGLLRKDTQLALEMADGLDLSLDLGLAAARVFAHTEAGGWANSDDAAVVQWLAAQVRTGELHNETG
jgi:3-hydroxyisobutyrate dehydrogenase